MFKRLPLIVLAVGFLVVGWTGPSSPKGKPVLLAAPGPIVAEYVGPPDLFSLALTADKMKVKRGQTVTYTLAWTQIGQASGTIANQATVTYTNSGGAQQVTASNIVNVALDSDVATAVVFRLPLPTVTGAVATVSYVPPLLVNGAAATPIVVLEEWRWSPAPADIAAGDKGTIAWTVLVQ
jgi:hypothetical protein